MKRASLVIFIAMCCVIFTSAAFGYENVVVPYVGQGGQWTGIAVTALDPVNLTAVELDEDGQPLVSHGIDLCNSAYDAFAVADPDCKVVHIQGTGEFYVTRVIGDSVGTIAIETFKSD